MTRKRERLEDYRAGSKGIGVGMKTLLDSFRLRDELRTREENNTN